MTDNSDFGPHDSPPESTDTPEGYRILGEVERGAQGTVFRAEHLSTRRVVALKILHDGRFATSLQRKRFEREVDLLAQLRHPNIVTVHDSGRTARGSLYIAMEYVEGELIHQVTEREFDPATPRGLKDMVRLLIRVCDGVAFLHQNGVIHRDLKPSNIIIDAAGQPRIVDFGLARTEGAVAPDETATLEGEFAGTLAYAAPEQTRGDPAALDVRSDVYALGVIFYELLTRQLPYSTQGSLGDILENINDVVPPPPSSKMAGGLDQDLDRVLLKALAKDKDQRYESAAALRRDLERWLAGLPVEARPASLWYVLRKTMARHKMPFALGAIAVVLLALFAVSMSLAYRKAAIEAAKSNQIRIFLEDTLASVTPETPGSDVTVKQTLDEAVHWVEIALSTQPEVAASLRLTIGNSYRALGRHDEAEDQVQQAILLRRELFGEDHLEVQRANATLALIWRDRGDLAAAEDLMLQSLTALETELGSDNIQLTNMLMNLGSIHMGQSEYQQAQQVYERALTIRERELGPQHPDTAMCLFRLASLHATAGNKELARELHERAYLIRTTALHDEHPDIARSQAALADLDRP
jgi:tRNA A-37 threonylcarbamoyl transferase component Bud32/tetratricopeptide (TPR) repeat protein